MRTYALDRIESLYPLEDTQWFMQADFHPDLYFQHIVGVSLPEDQDLQRIRFKTTALRAKYIATKPLHPSQKRIVSNDKYSIFEIEVIPNIELIQIFLSLCKDLEVLEPLPLRKRIAAHLLSASQKYLQE